MNSMGRKMIRNAACFGVGLLVTQLFQDEFGRGRKLRGKVVVITGASRGLGLAMADQFARCGARLVLVARDRFALDRAQSKLLENGMSESDVLIIPADLRNRDEAENAMAQATAHFGRVDVLVNNAGIMTVGPVENQSVEQFRDVMDANFFSGVYCTLAVLPQMLQRRAGAIANITSIGGKIAVPHLLPYVASKYAAVGFSDGLFAEMKSKGVRVTTVIPGLMRTGSHRNAQFTGDAEREYRWFSLAASVPGLSIAASRAARKIVNGIADGAAEVIITPQAKVLSRYGNLAANATRMAMCGMNALLPEAQSGNPDMRRGEEVKKRELFPLTAFGSRAAHRYNQSERIAS